MASQSQIKIVICTECGKPCRTDAEKDMHTRFTGHASYVDKVSSSYLLMCTWC